MVGLGCRLESRESLAPHLVQVVPDLRESFGSDAIHAPGAVASLVEQPGILQHPQVLGDRGPGHVEVRGDPTGAELIVSNETQDLAPPRLRQRPYGLFH